MRLARFFLGGLLGLLILAGAAAWLLPPMLDWSRYRASFELLASSALGRPVVIEGPISLSLLPEPVLTAARVGVGDAAKPSGASLTVRAMRLRVALWPLLAGHVDARELVLRQPTLRLPWPLPQGAITTRPFPWIASFAAHAEGGTLQVGGFEMTGIDAVFSTGETGALSIAGSAEAFGRVWRVAGRLTSPGSDGSAGLDFAIDGGGKVSGVGVAFSGQLAADGSLAGHISARGPDLSQLVPAPAVPFRAEGRFTAAGGLAAADDLTMEIAGSPAQGAVALRVSPVQRLDIALAVGRLDLDEWLSAMFHGGGATLPIGIDLSAEAAVLNRGTLRRLRAGFDLAGDTIAAREVSAILPGEASLRFAGRITRPDRAEPSLIGSAQLDAPDFRTTLAWLTPGGFSGIELPAGILRRAKLKGDIRARPGEITVDGLQGEIDGSDTSGRLILQAGSPPAIHAELTIGRLDLGAWSPDGLSRRSEPFRVTAGFNAELHLTAAQVVWRSVSVQHLVLDFGLGGERLALRRLQGEVQGIHLAASGVIEAGRLAEFTLQAVTRDAGPLGTLIPAGWPSTPALWSGPASLSLTAAGASDALSVHLGLDLADARLEAQPVIDLGTGQWSGPATLRHPGARRLIATLGVLQPFGALTMPSWIGEGSLSLLAQMAGAPDRIDMDSFDLTAGSLRAKGQLALDRSAEEPRVSGRIEAEAIPVPLIDWRSPDPLPLKVLEGWHGSLHLEARKVLADFSPVLEQLAFEMTVAGGALRLDRVTAQLGGGILAGSATVDTHANPPAAAVSGSITEATTRAPLFDEPWDLDSGRVAGSFSLTASGYSPGALLATLAG
ncbi:MAG: AsmA family protein, partial [Acetobacteraceae bacterium]|nr:AsmA family protein [Acetobacteraceae bacterium]